MMMGKGKGGRRNVAESIRDDEMNEDMVEAFNALSSDDKKRLLDAMQHDDVKMVDAIFDDDRKTERKLPRTADMDDEPTPEDFFGVLGIFPSFCESKIGSSSKKCRTPAPIAVPQMMMGKGKGGRRNVAESIRDDEMNEDMVEAFNALSSDDKKRLLDAMQHDDVHEVDAIFSKNNERALFFGKLGIFPSFCESKIGKKFVKCLTSPPTPAPIGKGSAPSPVRKSPVPAPVAKGKMEPMGKRDRRRRVMDMEGQIMDDAVEELLQLYNTMTSSDKKRLLLAIERDDDVVMDELLAQYHFV